MWISELNLVKLPLKRQYSSLLTIVHLVVKEHLGSLAAIEVFVHLLNRVEHCIRVFFVVIHFEVLTRAMVLVSLVKLAEASFKNVALRIAQLGILFDVYVPVEVSKRRPQIRSSFPAELAVEDHDSPSLHKLR